MTRMPDVSPDIPFDSAWVSWDLGEFRPCEHATYCEYPCETLPPLPAPDPSFRWLPQARRPMDPSERSKRYWQQWLSKLGDLEREAARLGFTLPTSFLTFMGSLELLNSIEPGCGSWFYLGDRLVPCPGFEGAYLIGFLCDQQDCMVWCLCLTPGGESCVLCVYETCFTALPLHDEFALLGRLDFLDEEDEKDAAARDEAERLAALAAALPEIRACAPSFEAFIQRYALECNLGGKLVGLDATPPTAEELRYLEHYSRQIQAKS